MKKNDGKLENEKIRPKEKYLYIFQVVKIT